MMKKLYEKFDKFMEVFKILHVDILLLDAFEQMPHYKKFLKKIMSKKKKCGFIKIVDLCLQEDKD